MQADIKEKVVTLLIGQQWSPEQISKRMELERGVQWSVTVPSIAP